jgi:hypothetical protein
MVVLLVVPNGHDACNRAEQIARAERWQPTRGRKALDRSA